jgi:hypothetical protein
LKEKANYLKEDRLSKFFFVQKSTLQSNVPDMAYQGLEAAVSRASSVLQKAQKRIRIFLVQRDIYSFFVLLIHFFRGIYRIKSHRGLNVSIKLSVLSLSSGSFEQHEPFLLPEYILEAVNKKPGRPAAG